MAGEMRERMVEGAMGLLAQRGLHATSFSEVLAATGAPRGSLYHHFPGGKDELMAAAVDRAGAVLVDERFLAIWRFVLTQSQCESGCAVLAVTVATDSAELLSHATTVFRAWRERLAQLLRRSGLPAAAAKRFATVMIASVEGAVVLSRAERSLEPFEIVATQLMEQAHAMMAAKSKG